MKTLPTILVTLAVAVPATWFATRTLHTRGASATGTTDQSMNGGRKVIYYQSAMHPWIKSPKEGRCTICGMELTPVYEGGSGFDAAGGGDIVPLTQTMIQVMNVQTAEVQTRPLQKTLTVAGVIDDDDTRHRVLSAYIPGRVQKLYVNFMGAEVKEGQPLVDFYSPTLLQSEREYRTLTGELRDATALRLLQMGLTAAQIDALPGKSGDKLTSQLLAPISGTVVEKSVYEGQYVQEGEKLFEIADFSTMWFQFRAYEQDLPWIKPGLKVDVTMPSHPGETFTGNITFIDPNFEEATRSTKVRVELTNPSPGSEHRMLHRLYADGLVHLDAPEVLTVPRSAVVQTGPDAVVYVDKGGGAYARQLVKLGRRGDHHIEVLKGVQEGEKVVTNGNLLIDGQAEMNRSFAEPAAIPTTAAEVLALTEIETKAVRTFYTLVEALSESLAADNLEGFNAQAAKTHLATPALLAAFPEGSAWRAYLKAFETAGHLNVSPDLKAARKAFYTFSNATVPMAQALRRSSKDFSSWKVFNCPMAASVFPGAPTTARWIQLKSVINNPYMGLRMSDCGTEVN